MKTLLFVLIVLGLFVFILLKQNKKPFLRAVSGAENEEWPYVVKQPLTQPEQILYHRLVAALPECQILAQVSLLQILGVKRGFQSQAWNNKIAWMSIDFLVCLPDFTIVAAVELDDKTHERLRGIENDAKKNKALASAGITLIRWHVNAMPDEATIRKTFV